MSKKARERRFRKRLARRLKEGRASREDISLDMIRDWNRSYHRSVRRWMDSQRGLLMDDSQHMDYCLRDWVPQLIHKGRKP